MILTVQWKISSDKALKNQRFGNQGRISCVWLGVLCVLLLLLQNVTRVRVMFLLKNSLLKAVSFFFPSVCLSSDICQFFLNQIRLAPFWGSLVLLQQMFWFVVFFFFLQKLSSADSSWSAVCVSDKQFKSVCLHFEHSVNIFGMGFKKLFRGLFPDVTIGIPTNLEVMASLV